MWVYRLGLIFAFSMIAVCSCQDNNSNAVDSKEDNDEIKYAKGLSILNNKDYTIVKIHNPWPEAKHGYTYILKRKNAAVPDSLRRYPSIEVPINKIIVTSTTHIPSLEMLGMENTLIGFPGLGYISSAKVRKRIDVGQIRELGSNQALNTELIIDMQPDVIMGYGIDNSNPMLENLTKSGLKIIINGDWNEQTPLGKAEWIKLYGVLYGMENKATSLFANIESEYLKTMEVAKKASNFPTVMAGAIFENKWYLPHGNSWGSHFVNDAGGDYLWKESNGTGSLSLSFESVLDKARDAEFWIGPGQFTSLQEMIDSNPHYAQFAAFKNRNVYSFSTKKGKTGGVVYYELAPNRPDIVLKDVVSILHPELLPEYELYFFEKLN